MHGAERILPHVCNIGQMARKTLVRVCPNDAALRTDIESGVACPTGPILHLSHATMYLASQLAAPVFGKASNDFWDRSFVTFCTQRAILPRGS